jgi:hypothetical protein
MWRPGISIRKSWSIRSECPDDRPPSLQTSCGSGPVTRISTGAVEKGVETVVENDDRSARGEVVCILPKNLCKVTQGAGFKRLKRSEKNSLRALPG